MPLGLRLGPVGGGPPPNLVDGLGGMSVLHDATTNQTAGFVGFAYRANGDPLTSMTVPWPHADAVSSSAVALDWAYNLALSTGQSLDQAHNAIPSLNTSAVSGGLRFNGGVRPHDTSEDPAVANSSLVSLLEQDSSTGSNGETHHSSAVKSFDAFWTAGQSQTMVGAGKRWVCVAAGEGGASIYRINPHYVASSLTIYDRIPRALTAFKTLSASASKTCGLSWIEVIQGNADKTGVSKSQYKAMFRRLHFAIEDSRAALGFLLADGVTADTRRVPCAFYQFTDQATNAAAVTIQQAQYELDTEDFYKLLVCPSYFFPYATDHLHMTNIGQQWLGGYFARARYMWMIQRIRFRPVKPLRIRASGSTVIIDFDVQSATALAFDDGSVTGLTDPGNKGFNLWDSGGGALTITGVTLTGAAQITITSNATVAAGFTVSYGRNGTTAIDPGTGPRGLVRDTSLDTVTTGSGSRPLYNFLPIFQMGAFG